MNASFSPRVRLMGILNVTPDSFSDGGQFSDPQSAAAHALGMIAGGASMIDIGGESTRPGSKGVPAAEQLVRILPVLRLLRAKTEIELSIDTQSAEVAEACLGEGADIINDISALRHDPRMPHVLSRAKTARVILMHMRGTPEDMQNDPRYADVAGEIIDFFHKRIGACEQAGIAPRRLLLDPGFGFGKTFRHNLEIVRRFEEFQVLGRQLVAGVSRKSFLGKITGEKDPARLDAPSIAAGIVLAKKGVYALRVHDVAGHRGALKAAETLGAL